MYRPNIKVKRIGECIHLICLIISDEKIRNQFHIALDRMRYLPPPNSYQNHRTISCIVVAVFRYRLCHRYR